MPALSLWVYNVVYTIIQHYTPCIENITARLRSSPGCHWLSGAYSGVFTGMSSRRTSLVYGLWLTNVGTMLSLNGRWEKCTLWDWRGSNLVLLIWNSIHFPLRCRCGVVYEHLNIHVTIPPHPFSASGWFIRMGTTHIFSGAFSRMEGAPIAYWLSCVYYLTLALSCKLEDYPQTPPYQHCSCWEWWSLLMPSA